MSSSKKIFGVIAVLLLAFVFYAATTKADVTGSFGVNISYEPFPCQLIAVQSGEQTFQFYDQPCEKTFFKIDFETDFNVNIAISGLTMGLHAHAGVTGFEDIILSFAATLGALDISDTFVFAQPYEAFYFRHGDYIDPDIPGTETIPVCRESEVGSGVCQTLFVKKRVEATISLGGVTFTNLALFEDVTFPQYCDPYIYYWFGACVPNAKSAPTYNVQSQHFGFGDVITVEGQTPSGITVRSETGVCASQLPNTIKKHRFEYSVNPDCYTGVLDEVTVKSPLFFDFEKLWIQGIPLAENLTLDLQIYCGKIPVHWSPGYIAGISGFTQDCSFENLITLTNVPIFDTIMVASGFRGGLMGPAVFTDVEVTAASGPLSLTIDFSPSTFTPTYIYAVANFTINPDTNPASLRLRAIGYPGLTFFDARLSITRSGLTFYADLDWDVNSTTQTFDFDDLTFGLSAEAGVVTFDASIVIDETGSSPESSMLAGGDVTFTISF